jgi:hypothetical protein
MKASGNRRSSSCTACRRPRHEHARQADRRNLRAQQRPEVPTTCSSRIQPRFEQAENRMHTIKRSLSHAGRLTFWSSRLAATPLRRGEADDRREPARNVRIAAKRCAVPPSITRDRPRQRPQVGCSRCRRRYSSGRPIPRRARAQTGRNDRLHDRAGARQSVPFERPFARSSR